MVSYHGALSWDATGVRWYFPEWADRPAQDGTPQESDRNSYMAGGYAEEFGYHPQRGGPPAFTTVDGDPERSKLWRVQIEGMHPGYPERPRPLDREVVQPRDFAGAESSVVLGSPEVAYHTDEASHRLPADFTVVRVGERGRSARKHAWLPIVVSSRWKEFRIRRRELGGLF